MLVLEIIFLDVMPKAQTTETQVNKWAHIKLKTLGRRIKMKIDFQVFFLKGLQTETSRTKWSS